MKCPHAAAIVAAPLFGDGRCFLQSFGIYIRQALKHRTDNIGFGGGSGAGRIKALWSLAVAPPKDLFGRRRGLGKKRFGDRFLYLGTGRKKRQE